MTSTYKLARTATLCLATACTWSAAEETPRVIVVGAGGGAGSAPGWLQSVQSVTEVDREALDRWDPGRLEDLTGLLPGAVVEPINAGLSTGIKVRGFTLTRLHRDGLPDVQRMFVRDPYTVERIELLRGPAAALMGITSPGGVLNYVSKHPSGRGRTEVGASAGSNGHTRLTFDSTGPFGAEGSPLRYRLLGTAEDGQMSWAELPQRRIQGLVALQWQHSTGLVGVELQNQRNQTPFSFGTVITNRVLPGMALQRAEVAWDRLLVLEGGAPAQRRYHEARLRWEQRIAPGLLLRTSLAQAIVTRDETLLGFWTLLTPTTVSAYYTTYHDAYRQRAGRIEMVAQLVGGGMAHDLHFGFDAYRQRFHFEGVQNIGGASVGIEQPDFSSIDPAALALSTRYNDERLREEAVWAADKLSFGQVAELVVAARRQSYHIEADRSGAGRVPVAGATQLTGMAGLSLRVAATWRAWLSASNGMEPNRGRRRDGDFLPPQTSRQAEIGLERATAAGRTKLALWRIDLRQLPLTDPTDRSAVISAGERRVDGVELVHLTGIGPWLIAGNVSLQRTRQLVRTSSNLGDRFVGVPEKSGGLQLALDLPQLRAGAQAWLGVVGVGWRMANSEGSVRVPGYVRLDAGLRWPLGSDGSMLQFGVRNLGDLRYVESVTALDNVYQGPRRQWRLALRMEL